MALAEHLHPDAVLFSPPVRNKWQLLGAMVDRLTEAAVLDPERGMEALSALVARERSVSTGMEEGIAVPHAALEGIDRILAAVAVLPRGLEFDSLDGQPARIVVCLLVPKHEKILHVRTLTEVARRLGDPAFRERVLAATDSAGLIDLWR